MCEERRSYRNATGCNRCAANLILPAPKPKAYAYDRAGWSEASRRAEGSIGAIKSRTYGFNCPGAKSAAAMGVGGSRATQAGAGRLDQLWMGRNEAACRPGSLAKQCLAVSGAAALRSTARA
jgi:hypothetical protein